MKEEKYMKRKILTLIALSIFIVFLIQTVENWSDLLFLSNFLNSRFNGYPGILFNFIHKVVFQILIISMALVREKNKRILIIFFLILTQFISLLLIYYAFNMFSLELILILTSLIFALFVFGELVNIPKNIMKFLAFIPALLMGLLAFISPERIFVRFSLTFETLYLWYYLLLFVFWAYYGFLFITTEELKSSRDKLSKQKNSIGMSIALSFLTFGIYAIFWLYEIISEVELLLNENTKEVRKEFFLCVLIPFYIVFWFYSKERMFFTMRESKFRTKDNSTLYLILSLFGLSILVFALIQFDLNQFSSSKSE